MEQFSALLESFRLQDSDLWLLLLKLDHQHLYMHGRGVKNLRVSTSAFFLNLAVQWHTFYLFGFWAAITLSESPKGIYFFPGVTDKPSKPATASLSCFG